MDKLYFIRLVLSLGVCSVLKFCPMQLYLLSWHAIRQQYLSIYNPAHIHELGGFVLPNA
jgi:hypothetical protein